MPAESTVDSIQVHARAGPTRRAVLAAGAAGLALAALPLPRARGDDRRRLLRLAHLTDLHIQPERHAAEGVARCLAHVAEHARPDLILTGGDLVMDAFDEDEARTRTQWDLLTKAFHDGASAPVLHTLGNHDIWGWNKGKSRTRGTERLWGKAWALEALGLERAFNASTHAGWKIIRLDSVVPDPADPDGYIARIADEQWAWLESELKDTPEGTHVLICSHVPLHTATALFGKVEPDGKRRVSGGLMHTDNRRLLDLFARHPAVKCCVSGHTHRVERLVFRGIEFLCNGAVSGNWWKGAYHEAFEGYALLDLFDDGTVESRYTGFDWKA